MNSRLTKWTIASLLAASSALALADSPSTSFTPGALAIHVTAIQGGAQYRGPGETKWHALKSNSDLAEGGELRTGPKGSIQFMVGTDQVYRVDRLTVVKLLRANLSPDGTIKTDVGMTYGRVSKDVDAPTRPHQDTIVTPSSTLAVRGTRVALFDQPPFEPEAVCLTGTAAAGFARLGRVVTITGSGGANGKSTVSDNNPNAADNLFADSTIDPEDQNAETSVEQHNANFNRQQILKPISNPPAFPTVSDTGMPTYSQLQSMTTGALTFYVTWNSNTPVEFQLIAAIAGGGEFAYPVLGYNQSKNGGRIPFQNLGGPGGGYETINYSNLPPTGFYTVEAVNVGNVATHVTFSAFTNLGSGLEAQKLATFPTPFPQQKTINDRLAPGGTSVVYTFVPQSSSTFVFPTGNAAAASRIPTHR